MTMATRIEAGSATFEHVALVDLLDRVLTTGVVVSGDLVYISLHALLSSVRQDGPGPITFADGVP